MSRSFLSFIAALLLLTSCEKDEKALVLPPTGTSIHGSVSMGNDYTTQVFYDFDSQNKVYTSSPNSWDLAFDATADGNHIYMNGGDVNIQIYNTHKLSFQDVMALPPECASASSVGWRKYDDPDGMPDQTGMGDLVKLDGSSKGEVYIVQNGKGVTWKLRLLSVSSANYRVEWAPLASAAPIAVQLDKDTAYNFIYFSFDNGIVKPEPPKDTWDIVFTHYRYLYRNYQNSGYDFPYPVSGALLNPYHTTGAADSITAFGTIDLAKASAMPMTNHRDVIGSDWKQYDFGTSRYVVNSAKNYVLHTRKDKLYKLHFIGYYNSAGEKGNPDFEYERLK